MANLANCVHSLSPEQLLSFKSDLVAAGIALSTQGDYRTIFRKGRETSKGKLKILYTALYKAPTDKLNQSIDTLVAEIEK